MKTVWIITREYKFVGSKPSQKELLRAFSNEASAVSYKQRLDSFKFKAYEYEISEMTVED